LEASFALLFLQERIVSLLLQLELLFKAQNLASAVTVTPLDGLLVALQTRPEKHLRFERRWLIHRRRQALAVIQRLELKSVFDAAAVLGIVHSLDCSCW